MQKQAAAPEAGFGNPARLRPLHFLKLYTVFTNGVRPLRHRNQSSPVAVILSEVKDPLLYAGIGPFLAEKQIPRCARNDNALWFTPTVTL